MSHFKIDGKVEITGPTSDGYSGFIGLPSVVAGFGPDSEVRVRLPNCVSTIGFPQSSLRLLTAPALAPGVRVKTTQDSRPSWLRGMEGVIADVWVDDNRLIGVDMADGRTVARYEADELEVLPDREPQPAEVWRHNRTGGRYVVIEVGKQKEADEWHAAVMYRPQLERQMYSRRLESFLESFTRS
jgi:hypothetical protein